MTRKSAPYVMLCQRGNKAFALEFNSRKDIDEPITLAMKDPTITQFAIYRLDQSFQPLNPEPDKPEIKTIQ